MCPAPLRDCSLSFREWSVKYRGIKVVVPLPWPEYPSACVAAAMGFRKLSICLSLSLGLVARAANPVFSLDCSDIPGPCNNDCYAIFNANRPQTLEWKTKAGAVSGPNRKAAGCVPNPCCAGARNKIDAPNDDQRSCDEYPYASTQQGGPGAMLRCTDEDENVAEGRQLIGFYTRTPTGGRPGCERKACTFDFAIDSGTIGNMYFIRASASFTC